MVKITETTTEKTTTISIGGALPFAIWFLWLLFIMCMTKYLVYGYL